MTEFEKLLKDEGLKESNCLESAKVVRWIKRNRYKRFVPEKVLFDLQIAGDVWWHFERLYS